MDRRESIKTLALVPLATALGWSTPVTEPTRAVNRFEDTNAGPGTGSDSGPNDGPDHGHGPGSPHVFQDAPKFFTEHEFETVRVLSDWVIPADDRSGSATDAQVPEFIDFTMVDQPWRQTSVRGGLAWVDAETDRRFGSPFIECEESQQRELLDLIAYPERAPSEVRHGVQFFNHFRDLVASGFWSSKMGVEDLNYMGNQYAQDWNGCGEEVLRALNLG